jgi:histone-lysine N-methyltransferase SETMAR
VTSKWNDKLFKEWDCGILKSGVILATQKQLAYLGFQCLDHPPYSPDLVLSDYHLFPGMKKQLEGRHLSSEAEVITAAGTSLDGQHSECCMSGLQKLEQRDKKCIELRGE